MGNFPDVKTDVSYHDEGVCDTCIRDDQRPC
jgi:hypothetical protein